MPDLAQLQTFVLTSELGSLAAAARQLGISPAAISKQLTRLEQELGVQLLHRSTRRIALTEIGNHYYQQCRRIFEEVEAASALVSQVKAMPHGQLKVVSGRHFASTYITPCISEFLSLYPQIELQLELAERIPDLHAEGIDVMIGMSISATGDVIQKKIASTRYAYCASPNYLNQYGTPIKPDDLHQHRYITHSMRRPDDELEFGPHKVVKLKPYIRVNDAQTMLHFALEGLGIVKLHHYVVNTYLKQGNLQEVFRDYTHQEIPLYVAYPQRRFMPSKSRCFIDFITAKFFPNTSMY